MVNYSRGKIYSIRSHSRPDLIYIGSTADELCKRMSSHRAHYRSWQTGKRDYTTSYDIIALGDAYIELIENYPCADRGELTRREGQIIRQMNCVNRVIPGRTKREYGQQYYVEHQDEIKAKNAQWRADHKDEINTKNAQYRADHKDEINTKNAQWRAEHPQYHAQYYAANREKLNAKKRVKYQCGCGAKYSHGHKLRHFRSKKHQFWQRVYDFIYS